MSASRGAARVLALVIALGAPSLSAQGPLVVGGRVVRVTPRGDVPVPNATVVLHRIGATAASSVDSMSTARDGRFRFRVAAPDTGAMYLATSRYGGIAYFAPPVRGTEPGPDADIQVFDTTTAPVRLQVTGRHMVVSAPDAGGRREVIEVYELQNDSVVTRLASRERPAFSAEVPEGAADVRARQGDFVGDAVVVEPGRIHVVSPFAPGVRQLAFSYTLAPAAFPLAITLREAVSVFEVLLEEPTGRTIADSVQALGAVSAEGRSFVRFLGRDLPAGRSVQVQVPVSGSRGSSWLWLAGLGIASLGAVAWSLRPRRAKAVAATAVGSPSRVQELDAAIAGVAALLDSPDTAPASLDALRAYLTRLEGERDALLAAGGNAD